MLRITKLSDYAIVLLSRVAREQQRSFTAQRLSEKTGIPMPTVSKVLKQLVRAGLFTSERGKHGGYLLARPPTDIKLVDVIDAVEGPVAMTECSLSHECDCGLLGSCQLQPSWQTINQKIRGVLADTSIADMIVHLSENSPRLVELRAGDADPNAK